KARGGKLIMYHGWNDPAIPALNTIDYFQSVEKRMGNTDSESFLRLFIAPGMAHCGGGAGPNAFGAGVSGSSDPERNMYRALELWVEQSTTPGRMNHTKNKKNAKHHA